MNQRYKKVKRYRGGRHVEVDGFNPEMLMKKLQRWLKEENFFIEIREREFHTTKSEKKRKKTHLAKSRETRRWRKMEEEHGPLKPKRIRNKANRGKKTLRREVKKPNA